MELTKIQFEDGQKVSDAYVEINGVKHPVTKAQYQGKTPLSARNLNKMQENMETAISDLDERVVSYRNVLVDEQALIKECGGLKLKKLNKLVGKTEQEGEPTPENPSEVKTVTGNIDIQISSDNMLEIPKSETQTINGLTVVVNNNGSVTLKGTTTGIAAIDFNLDNQPILNGEYTFSLKIDGAISGTDRQQWLLYDTNNSQVGLSPAAESNTTKTKTSIVNNKKVSRLRIYTKAETTVDCTIYPKLEKGSKATEYTQFKGLGIYPLTLGSLELCKIGDYADYIYRNGSKCFKHNKIVKYVFTGDENWRTASSVAGGTTRFLLDKSDIINNKKTELKIKSIYSNRFKALSWIELYREDTTTKNAISCYDDYQYDTGRIVIRIDNNVASTVEELKAYLKENETYCYYVLATPTDTEITDTTLIAQLNALENAQLYEDITNISITGDNLTPIADIDYWTWFKGETGDVSDLQRQIDELRSMIENLNN